jgi:hypothetical protein
MFWYWGDNGVASTIVLNSELHEFMCCRRIMEVDHGLACTRMFDAVCQRFLSDTKCCMLNMRLDW